jgi:DNA polymerase
MSKLIDVAVDFETYYGDDYSLRKMMITEYLYDPRFEIIGASIALHNALPCWFSGDLEYMRNVFSKIPWHRSRFIAHNAFFDASILEWKLGFKAAKYFCTMMGSRPYVAPYTGSMSLHHVANYFGLGVKGNEVESAKNKRRVDFSPIELVRYGEYCNNDNHLCGGIAQRLDGYLPADEADLIDLTVKKFVRPKLVLDRQVISDRLAQIETNRTLIEGKAKALGAAPSTLRSREKFAAVLRTYGVEPETKISKTTGLSTLAFAKDDDGMVNLLTHSDPRVRTLAEAKIFTSSSMETKRLERFQTLYDLNVGGRSLLPVPLLYYGAHTGRLAGYDKINLQNLTRVKRDKLTREIQAGHLRFALTAPHDHSVIAADLSNIEARIVATLSGCAPMREGFRNKVDLYCEFASKIYGRKITKADEIERFVGKTCILGLGYGMGWMKFGMQMKIARVKMNETLQRHVVYLYRSTYPEVPALWATLEHLLTTHSIPKTGMFCWGPLTFAHERIILPNGMPLIYPGLHISRTTGKLTYMASRNGKSGPRSLWGGTIAENVVQALAKIVISTAEVTLARAGLRSVLQVHDELVYCVPTIHVTKITKAIDAVLCAQVPWLPLLPVACEIKSGPTYGDAK